MGGIALLDRLHVAVKEDTSRTRGTRNRSQNEDKKLSIFQTVRISSKVEGEGGEARRITEYLVLDTCTVAVMILGPPDPPPISRTRPLLSSTIDGHMDDRGLLKG